MTLTAGTRPVGSSGDSRSGDTRSGDGRSGDHRSDGRGFASIAAVVGALFAFTAAVALIFVGILAVNLVSAFNRGVSDIALASQFLTMAQCWGAFLACALGMLIARGMGALVATSRR